jgi:hypothetical protein
MASWVKRSEVGKGIASSGYGVAKLRRLGRSFVGRSEEKWGKA